MQPQSTSREPSFAGPVPGAGSVRVVLADDDDMLRDAVAALLTLVDDVSLVGEARDGIELVALVDRCQPDLVVTDIKMPRMDGLEALARIRAAHPDVRALVVSMHESSEMLARALRSGARGYVCKTTLATEFEPAVRSIIAGGMYPSGGAPEQRGSAMDGPAAANHA